MTKRPLMRMPLLALLPALAASACGEGAPPGASSPEAPTGEAVTAERLVGAWIDAVGGMRTYQTLESARYTVTTEIYDTRSGRLKRTRPRYVTLKRTAAGELTRVERWEGDDLIIQGWDGSEAWATLNGAPLAVGDKDYDQVPYVAGDLNYWISLPFKLRDPGVNLHYRGMDEGRHLVTVSFGEGIGLHDGDTWRYWFDGEQAWPEQIAYREEGKEDWNTLRPEDLQTVAGYPFIGRRVHFDEDGRITKVLRTYDFEFNPSPAEEAFRRP